MKFDDLLNDTQCNCIENAIQDNENLFARKINKPKPLDKDFRSHWERGKRAEQCKEICGYKGLSMNKWDKSNESSIINKFLTTFSITPKHKDSIFVFRVLEGAGLVKYTPTKDDNTHHDFYKSDGFSLEMFENYSIISLKDLIKNE